MAGRVSGETDRTTAQCGLPEMLLVTAEAFAIILRGAEHVIRRTVGVQVGLLVCRASEVSNKRVNKGNKRSACRVLRRPLRLLSGSKSWFSHQP